MMRPSHPISTTLPSHLFSRRLAAAGLVVAIQIVIAWTLISALAVRLGDSFHPFKYVSVKEQAKPSMPPPPLPHIKDAAPPIVAPPIFTFDQEPGPSVITMGEPQQQATLSKSQLPPVKVVPDRPAAAIAATQTTPPYPAMAQRLGAEGKVVLRLSVLADGTVGEAQIVTSSGRHDLDEVAQQWILKHWVYKPALKDGAPAPSELLAAVQFTLKDAP
jgi:protein TonB